MRQVFAIFAQRQRSFALHILIAVCGRRRAIEKTRRKTNATLAISSGSDAGGPNYANVVGNMSGAAVANVYYPQSDRTVGGTIGRGVSVTAQGIIGSEVIEFWPDIVRHHQRKQAEKLARQGRVPSATQPAPVPPDPTTHLPPK